MDCTPPVSSFHGISQARILEWIAISFSRGSSWPRDWTWVSCIAGGFFTDWATKRLPHKSKHSCINSKWDGVANGEPFHCPWVLSLVEKSTWRDKTVPIRFVACLGSVGFVVVKNPGSGDFLAVQWLNFFQCGGRGFESWLPGTSPGWSRVFEGETARLGSGNNCLITL